MDSTLIWIPTAISSSIYIGVHAVFAERMLRSRPPPERAVRTPRVTILKPVAGVDDELRENLESFARLDYPDYELLLGVASPLDPAVPILRAFAAHHPRSRYPRHLHGPGLRPQSQGRADDRPHARSARRGHRRLRRQCPRVTVVSARAHGRIAQARRRLVSSLVVGSGERTLGASIENAQLGAFIAPAVVCSATAGRAITVGKSMAMRRSDLEGIGGFRSVARVLAEDDVLGQIFRAKGYAVELCLHAVHNRNVHCTVGRSIERHTRWAKMRRAIAPRAFAFELLLTPILIAALTLCIAPSASALRAPLRRLGIAMFGCHDRASSAPLEMASWQFVAIEPLRALLLLFCWLRACTSRRVEWRGNPFRVSAGSDLSPIAIETPASGRIPL